jgi:putative tryptophan/tyrosine transport system substrate-binding protein
MRPTQIYSASAAIALRRVAGFHRLPALTLLMVALVAGAACSPATRAEPIKPTETKFYRIGFLSLSAKAGAGFDFPDTVQRLRELGYIEGKNYEFVERHAENQVARLPALARELVDLRVDLIIAATRPGVVAAKNATSTIPIVMTGSSQDPEGDGLVMSVARPGGNVTGLAAAPRETEIKRLQLLATAVPGISRVMVLGWSAEFLDVDKWHEEALRLRIELIPAELQTTGEIPAAFAGALQSEPQGLVVAQRANLSGPAIPTIVEFATEHRLPSIAPWRKFAEDGGLMSYEARASDGYRRVAEYVHRIFSGENPAEMPVEAPRYYDLVVNRRAERILGLGISPAALREVNEILDY